MKSITSILAFALATFAVAADSRDYTPHNFSQLPPRPTVESLDGALDIDVTYATGQPNINIPIYEVRQGALVVPIGIAYHGGGIKVNETAGIVGLGWSLDAGASITRTVNGLPDEMLEEDVEKSEYENKSARHLTKIKTIQGDSIMFEYQEAGKLLKRIVAGTETVEFEYETKSVSLSAFSTRYDRLTQIVVHRGDAKSTVVKKFKFTQTQSPFDGKYGGLLSRVDCLSANGKEKCMQYSFNYYLKGDRQPDEAQTMIGVLRRINYPTGGYQTFDWEQHDYCYVNGLKNEERVTTTSIPRNYTLCGRKHSEHTEQPIALGVRTVITVDVSKYFSMFDALGYLNGDDGWKDYNNSHSPLYSDYYPSVKILDGNNNVVNMVFIDRENSASPNKIALEAGAYRIVLYNPRNIALADLKDYFERENAEGDFGIVDIAFEEVVEERSDARRRWGGLRIKAVSSFANDDTNATLRRTFKYCDSYSNSRSSSGVVSFEPGYSGILYHRVFETQETGSGDIVTQYDFSTAAYKRGRLMSKTVFSPSDKLLRRQYDYQYYSLSAYASRVTGITETETSVTGATSVRTSGYSYFSDQSPDNNLCRLVKSVWTVNSSGQKEETFFTYMNSNRNLVVSEVTVCEGTIISAKRNEYDDHGRVVRTFSGEMGRAVLDKYHLGEMLVSDELVAYISIPEFEYVYDSSGNIVQISFKGRVLASYLWAYGGRYPIVEALGTDYATLLDKAGVGAAALQRLSDESELKSVFKSIRQGLSDCDITTMVYKWLTGVTEVVDSSGMTTVYSYDTFNRLEGVKDANQYYIKKFEYQYRQQ